MKTGRPRSIDIPTKVEHCPRQNKPTEHRRWRRGVDKDGQPRLVWICTECHNEDNKSSHARRRKENA